MSELFNISKEILFNPKDEKKFLNSVKRMVRSSYEYNEWVKFVKFTLGLDTCEFTGENAGEVTIELHHMPISMSNIIKTIFDKHMNVVSTDTVKSTDIVDEVLQLHKQNDIGYVLLCTTLHEKFHNGFLDIPIEYVKGNWQNFMNSYEVSDNIKELVEKYDSIKLTNTDIKVWNIQPGILQEIQ